MWTVEGEHIGQFGTDSWDLNSGVRNGLLRDAIQEEEFGEHFNRVFPADESNDLAVEFAYFHPTSLDDQV